MKRIYKYPIQVNDHFILELPDEAEILYIGMQKSEPFMWVLLDTEQSKEERHFYLYGTGMEVPDDYCYIDSFQMLNGSLIFHLFEV